MIIFFNVYPDVKFLETITLNRLNHANTKRKRFNSCITLGSF